MAKNHAPPDRQPPAATASANTANFADRATRARIERQARICTIYRHPQHTDIERTFLGGERPAAIVLRSNVWPGAVYRHARATGLFELRRNGLEFRGLPTPTRHIDLRAVRGLQGRQAKQCDFPDQNCYPTDSIHPAAF